MEALLQTVYRQFIRINPAIKRGDYWRGVDSKSINIGKLQPFLSNSTRRNSNRLLSTYYYFLMNELIIFSTFSILMSLKFLTLSAIVSYADREQK